MIVRIASIGLACLMGTAAASARDALLDAALARPALAPADAHGMVRITSRVVGGDDDEVQTEHVDPKKEPKKSLPSYADLRNVIGADAHVVGRDAGRTTYAFTTRHVPRAFAQAGTVSLDVDDKDDDEVFDGKAEVVADVGGQPYVERLELRMQQPEGNWVARVGRIDLNFAFGPDPVRTHVMAATAMDAEVDVRALFVVHRHVRVDAVWLPEGLAAR